ncbi:sigma receptor and C-8 sterol isomerase [Patellaria atrata CBS 101060]|uniref:C-8 sterol isomerase n=1 Tax=Patellaria atrata CBS 101060 TaxID=1346257 RepID=A0A9P4VV35_9PEZI|nr:sigma receptor and C-8 sterol isomerase [Patellaria atrata CBS 101060]
MSQTIRYIALTFAFIVAVFAYLNANLHKFYIFDPTDLQNLSLKAIEAYGNETRSVVDSIVRDLDKKFPNGYINTDEEWVFNNAGGAMGAMRIIHSSITEYVIIFGTAIGTEGHTGRHTADDYFHILHGTQLAHVPGSFEAEVYPQGSVHLLKRGQVKQYKMESTCFALEYARGWIPPMLAFGFADTFTSTLDFPTLWRTVLINGREILGNLLRGKF